MAESLDMEWNGASDIGDMVTAHFEADVLAHHPDKNVFTSWLTNPKVRGSLVPGCLYHPGFGYPNRPKLDEWVLAVPRLSEDPKHFYHESMIERIRSLDIPTLDIELKSVSRWIVNAKVTNHYRSKGAEHFWLATCVIVCRHGDL